MAILLMHFSFFSLEIALARLNLHLCAQEPGKTEGLVQSKRQLLTAARAIVELTRCIVPEAHTQVL